MKTHSTSGFGLIELVVIVAIVAMVGAGGYIWWTSQHSAQPSQNQSSNTTPTPTSTPTTVTTDPYAGWKTYTATTQSATFRYPSTWTLKDVSSEYSQGPEVTIASPAGTTIKYTAVVDGLGGACADPCPALSIYNITALQVAKAKQPLSLIQAQATLEDGTVNHVMAVVDKSQLSTPSQPLTVLYYATMPSHTSSGLVWFKLSQIPPSLDKLSGKDFFESADMVTAKQILASWQYQ